MKAHKFYDIDNIQTSSNQMLVKWCDLQILQNRFQQETVVKIIKAYEKVGNKYL
jgi:Ca2+-binding EF-hand superfamily protein